jgi:hypothetical protein
MKQQIDMGIKRTDDAQIKSAIRGKSFFDILPALKSEESFLIH